MEPKTCLLVDDDPEVREVLYYLIKQTKLFDTIIEAKDGNEASFKTQMQHFDTIISDINMPKKSGINFIEEALALQTTKSHRIIVMSAGVESVDIQKLKQLKVDKILVKPFPANRLSHLIISTWDVNPGTPKHTPEDSGLTAKLSAQ